MSEYVEASVAISFGDYNFVDRIRIDDIILRYQPDAIDFIKLEIEAHLEGLFVAIRERTKDAKTITEVMMAIEDLK